MKTHNMKYILTGIMLLLASGLFAQNSDRDCIRMGNKYFREKEYNKAETYYRKALDKNKSLEAFYNLGNALLGQNNDSVAFEQYKKALGEVAETKEKKAFVYHNMANMQYLSGLNMMKANSPDAGKAFQQAVELYKGALRCNPNDDETRYNLAMAQYMLKKNQQNQNQNQNQDKNQDQNKDQQNQDQNKDKQDQNKDKQDQDKNKDNKDNQDKQDQNKDQQDKQNQDKQNQDKQQQQPNEQKNQMDDKTAEQLLNSAQQDEKGVQRKVQKGEKAHRRGLEKDW